MPLHNLGNGCYRWGDSGARYCGKGAREKALRQMRAIEWRKHSGAELKEKFLKASLDEFEVKSIIFEKPTFTEESANQWLMDKGYNCQVEDMDEFYMAMMPEEECCDMIEYEKDVYMVIEKEGE